MTSTSTTLENLSAGTRYEVQVRAISDGGAGPYSNVGTNTTYRGIVRELLKTYIFRIHVCLFVSMSNVNSLHSTSTEETLGMEAHSKT